MVNTSNAADPEYKIKESYPVPDPDLEIRMVGGGGGHPDPEIRGGQSPTKFFQPFGPQFGLKIGGRAPPLDSLLLTVGD